MRKGSNFPGEDIAQPCRPFETQREDVCVLPNVLPDGRKGKVSQQTSNQPWSYHQDGQITECSCEGNYMIFLCSFRCQRQIGSLLKKLRDS